MLQRSPSWIKCVIRFIVQETAQRCHVDICKSRETPQEVSWILISSEYASKLCIEEIPVHLPVCQRENKDNKVNRPAHFPSPAGIHNLKQADPKICSVHYSLVIVLQILHIYNPGLEITVVESFTHLPLEISSFGHQKPISSLLF